MFDEADEIARHFHESYEALAPGFGYATRKESAVAWENVPASNKDLMKATVEALLNDGIIVYGPNHEQLEIMFGNVMDTLNCDYEDMFPDE